LAVPGEYPEQEYVIFQLHEQSS